MESGNIWLLLAIALVSFTLSFIGASVGLVLGHLRLPLLIAYSGSTASGAMTNLLVSGLGAMSGSVSHVRSGRVSWTGVALMGIPSAIGAVIAVLIFVQINPLWSYLVIGAVLLLSGVMLIRRHERGQLQGPMSSLRRVAVEVILGLALGALAAATGLMLGSLRLPMMIRYLRMDPKEAIGTNMAVGFLTAMTGAATGLLAGSGRLDGFVMAVVVPPTLLGGYLGGLITGRLSREGVQRLVGAIVALTGFILIGQGVTLAVRKPPTSIPPLLVDDPDYDGWFDFDSSDADETPSEEEKDDTLLMLIDVSGTRRFEASGQHHSILSSNPCISACA